LPIVYGGASSAAALVPVPRVVDVPLLRAGVSVIRFRVIGRPAPKGSPRVITRGRGGRPLPHPRVLTDSENSERWQALVRACATEHMKRTGDAMYENTALAVYVVFYLPRPEGHFSKSRSRKGELLPSAPGWPANKAIGDGDKLARSTFDGLSGVCFDDDARIVEMVVEKVYGAPIGALITIQEKFHGNEERKGREAWQGKVPQGEHCPHCGR
jgi:Holliday junction resolvase RusA-like endonuclease